MKNLNLARFAQPLLLAGLLFAAQTGWAQSNPTLAPVVSFVLNEPLTDRSNIQCTLELISLSPSVGSNIPVGSTFSATYSYQLSQRPLDVEVQISVSALEPPVDGSQTGTSLGSAEQRFIVGFDEGAESMSGQFTVSSVNSGVNAVSNLRDLNSVCIFFTLFDEMDAESNPGPAIGSRVQFPASGAPFNTTEVNWVLDSSGPQ